MDCSHIVFREQVPSLEEWKTQSSPFSLSFPRPARTFSSLSGEQIEAASHLSVFPHQTEGVVDSSKAFKTYPHRGTQMFWRLLSRNTGDFSDSHALYFLSSVNWHRGWQCYFFDLRWELRAALWWLIHLTWEIWVCGILKSKLTVKYDPFLGEYFGLICKFWPLLYVKLIESVLFSKNFHSSKSRFEWG